MPNTDLYGWYWPGTNSYSVIALHIFMALKKVTDAEKFALTLNTDSEIKEIRQILTENYKLVGNGTIFFDEADFQEKCDKNFLVG